VSARRRRTPADFAAAREAAEAAWDRLVALDAPRARLRTFDAFHWLVTAWGRLEDELHLAQLADKAGHPERVVRRELAALERAGILYRRQRAGRPSIIGIATPDLQGSGDDEAPPTPDIQRSGGADPTPDRTPDLQRSAYRTPNTDTGPTDDGEGAASRRPPALASQRLIDRINAYSDDPLTRRQEAHLEEAYLASPDEVEAHVDNAVRQGENAAALIDYRLTEPVGRDDEPPVWGWRNVFHDRTEHGDEF
jgi:hypothetical protein